MRKRISPQPFYRDDRQSGVDRVRNGTGSGHCCAKRVEEWILPRMDFGWDYAVPLSIPFDGRIYRAANLDGLPARSNLRSRKSRAISTMRIQKSNFHPDWSFRDGCHLMYTSLYHRQSLILDNTFVKMCTFETIEEHSCAYSIDREFTSCYDVTIVPCDTGMPWKKTSRAKKSSSRNSRLAEIRIMRTHTRGSSSHVTTHTPRIHVSRGMLNTRYRGSNLFDPRFE